ncbi:DEAD DEAH box helicase protein [Rutstroemia sp. NJR-2017a BVV2]|nr:DEAD DEAH box helicase protein [Rutstroemia sp. NJR-2017a BVV2]
MFTLRMSTSANAGADPASSSFEIRDHLKSVNPKSDVIGANHNSPAPTSTTEPDPRDGSQTDDAATMAASEELKHTTISEKSQIPSGEDQQHVETQVVPEDKEMSGTDKDTTPEAEPTDAQNTEMKERISSPKKKRGRDQDDDTAQPENDSTGNADAAREGGSSNGNRTMRTGPEKKRPRDTSEDPSRLVEKDSALAKEISTAAEPSKTTQSAPEPSVLSSESASTVPSGNSTNDKFASSGFGALASASTSPFGTLGATKPSIFTKSTESSVSGFAALAGSKSPNTASAGPAISTLGGTSTSGFGSAFGSGSASGFGALGSGSVFGSALGNGFSGGSGPKLSSFAAPGNDKVISGTKPVKPFGAPDSEEEDEDEDEDSEGGENADDEEAAKTVAEEKKKSKTVKVHIDDGEADEITLLQVRAKLFALGSKEVGWKERGVGTLKINAPKACVEFDDSGHSISGSFDSSALEGRSVRLIMRQENTHRVILNTVVFKAMEFKPKPSTNSAQILFTAFEGDSDPKPINMLLKMSEANYKLFTNEIESIQHEL